jgi:hypothetical protein
MDQHSVSGRTKALLALISTTAFLVTGCAQTEMGRRQGAGSATGTPSTLTGGAEAQPTDQGTPRGAAGSGPSNGGMPGSSGTSSTSRGNALTGGAEGAPTDQSTPGVTLPGGTTSSGSGGSSGSGKMKP